MGPLTIYDQANGHVRVLGQGFLRKPCTTLSATVGPRDEKERKGVGFRMSEGFVTGHDFGNIGQSKHTIRE